MSCQDALYTGSIQNLKEYKNAGEMNAYVSSVLNVPQDDEIHENSSFLSAAVRMLKQMFDFSLLKSPTFLLICGAGVLCFLGRLERGLNQVACVVVRIDMMQ